MTARRPALELVKEGNPGHRTQDRLARGLKLPPEPPPEPDWASLFPTVPVRERNATSRRLRTDARAEWRRVVPVLDRRGVLAAVDLAVVMDYAVCFAQIRECYRDIARHGVWVAGERGAQKNPSTTVLSQCRTAMKFYVTTLALSPLARDAMSGADDGSDDESSFD